MRRARRDGARSAAARAGEGLGPTRERWQKGDVEAMSVAIADEAGRPARPYRRVDLLGSMARKGTISAEMRAAGEDFHALFQRASLDPLRAPDLARTPHGRRTLERSESQEAAREKLARAVTAVGGLASPAGSCLWHVVGCEHSIKDWALRQGWNGRPLGQEQASGVLVAALGTLTAWWGM
jgi:hypothetical protein